MTATVTFEAEAQAAMFRECFEHLRTQLGAVFVGQPALIEQLIVCLLCQGHALLEGAPGVGKTLLIRTLSEAVNLRFARVQCTPDLMPADVTGTNILVETGPSREFVFQPGPIFGNVVLADEINRATPRTQSAFLEAMQEHHVTVFGTTHPIDAPFSVFATQNPIEMEGTYPLPEAQLDRFFFKLIVRAPSVDDLAEIVRRTTGDIQPTTVSRFGADEIRPLLQVIRHVKIADDVTRLALRLVRATHPDADEAPSHVREYVRYGASARGAQAIILGAKAIALLSGRYHVAEDDIRRVAGPALAHRLILNFHGEMEHVDPADLVSRMVASTRL
jgi:MoxR-like ATPase